MKRQLTIWMTVAAMVSITSCENLEPQFFDRLSPSIYLQGESDVKVAVTGAYSLALSTFGRVENDRALMMNTATTDEFMCFWGGDIWDAYRLLLWNSGTNAVTSMYGDYIKGITNCVNTIALIDPIEMNAELKARYQAELHGIMAFLAYYLYDFYGPTAIVVDPEITLNPDSDFQPERPTKEWMVAFIKEQARMAADALPISYSAGDYGRFTKGAALMVLLKLAMKEHDWDEAVAISTEMMELNHYQLQDSYLSVFSVENEMNNELVFVIPLTVIGNSNAWLAHALPGRYIEPNGIPIQKWGGYKVPWEMYEKYEESTDERLDAILRYIPTDNGMLDLRAVNEQWAQMGAIPYKYPADPASTGADHGNDLVIFRYADVLLLRAEALNNLNGPNQESIDLVNLVRNRAKISSVLLSQFGSKAALNDLILDERFRELFNEGHRRPDLIRHGKFLSEASKRGAPLADERHLVFAIPQWAIDENPKIRQNTGY